MPAYDIEHTDDRDRRTHRRSGADVLIVGQDVPSLAAARALAKAGYRVIVGDGGEASPVRYSNACHEVWEHPSVLEPGAFLIALDRFLRRRPEITHVMPIGERTIALLARERRLLPPRVRVASAPASTVITSLHKPSLYTLAAELGVPVQPWALAADRVSLREAADSVGYPCLVRPAVGASEPMPGGRRAVICSDATALGQELPAWPSEHVRLIVQRYAPGQRHGIAFAARRGRVLGLVDTTVTRTGSTDGTGPLVEGVSVDPDARLVRHTSALIERLRYTGIGLARFVVHDGEPHLLELSPRFGVALGLVQDLGLDLATGALELADPASTWTPPAGWSYRPGMRYAWTTGDLRTLRASRSRGLADGRRTARWLVRSVEAAARADVHATWSLSDPRPMAATLAGALPFGPWRRPPPERIPRLPAFDPTIPATSRAR